MHRTRKVIAVVVAALLTLVTAEGAAAADPRVVAPAGPVLAGGENAAELPDPLTREAVRELVSRLSDQEVRALLVRQLDRVATPTEGAGAVDGGFAGTMGSALHSTRERLMLMVSAAARTGPIMDTVVARLTAGKGTAHLWSILLFLAVVLAGGAAAEWVFRRLALGVTPPSAADREASVVDRLCLLAMRLLADAFAIAVFGLAAVALFFIFYQGHQPTREAIAAVFWSIIVIRSGAALARFALAPDASRLRLPPLSDEHARLIYRRFNLTVGAIALAYFLGRLFASLAADEGAVLLTGTVLTLLVLGLIVVIVWIDRRRITGLMMEAAEVEGRTPGRVRQLVGEKWPVFLTCLLVGLWIMSTVRRLLTGEGVAQPIIISLVVLLGLPVLDWIMREAVGALLRVPRTPPMPRSSTLVEAEGDETAEAGRTRDDVKRAYHAKLEYRDVVVRNLRIVLGVVAVVVLARLWNIDVKDMAATGVGATVAEALFHIVVTVVLASAAWGVIRTAINQAIRGSVGHEGLPEGEGGGKGGSRLQTLVPLLGKFLLIALVAIAAMVVLSQLGVDIGPLIAGAGVVGLAIGFGAQTLVKDIISGVFFLADDAFRVGEYVSIGSTRGSVEHISIRSLRLRHHNGPLHTVPFGEIRNLTNFSRDWAIMKLELRIPFDADLEKVRKIIKKVGQELMEDPEHGPHFLQPLKSQGVNRMDDSAFIIRVKFMARPGEQFTLRREVFRRIQEAFTEQGIHFAPRRVIVDTGGQPLAPAAAAAAALDAAGTDAAAGQESGDQSAGR